MFKHGQQECSEEMMQERKCEQGMKDCEMNEECKGKMGCEEMEEKSMCKEIIITDKDSMPKKQVSIKRK